MGIVRHPLQGLSGAGTLDNFTRLGPEYLTCTKCGTKNKTNFIPFNKMNSLEKGWIYFSLFLTYCIYGGLASFLIVGGISLLVDSKYPNSISDATFYTIFKISALIVISILSYFLFRKFNRDMKSQGY